MIETKVIKKDGTLQDWNPNKIARAINLASERAQTKLTTEETNRVISNVEEILQPTRVVQVSTLHDIVMSCLYEVNHKVYVEYKGYRNYKEKYKKSFANSYEFSTKIISGSFKENANKDSDLNSTKQALIAEEFMKNMMTTFEMKPEWVEAHNNCFIHIHDLGSRFIKSHNCNLFRLGNVMKNGFYLNGIYYKEPKSVLSMFQVGGDLVLSASAQQYGGFTVPKIDSIMERGCEYSYNKYYKDFVKYMSDEQAKQLAEQYTIKDIYQGWQAFETKLNTIANSLGQTPFVTVTFGLTTTKWGREIQKAILTQRLNGLGEKKTTAIFPKLVYLHRSEIADGINKDIKDLGIECSRVRLYPDWLSGDEGYQKDIFEKTGTMVDPMGCRAFLGEFIDPETGEYVIEGRANIGAVTINLPKLAKLANGDEKKFYEMLDHYTQMVWDIHLYTYEAISKAKGSSNPLFYCEGGAWKTVGYDEEIRPVVEGFTASLGYIGLEELSWALYGSSLQNNIEKCTAIVQHMWDLAMKAKKETGRLFTLYATPAESLIERFQSHNRKMFGVIKGFSDKTYMSNSFHQHVTIEHNPAQKMMLEKPMFDITQGGRIMYCEYPYNVDAKGLKQSIDFGMKLGAYKGVNIDSSTCNDCGHQGEILNNCPICNSSNITSVNRCCGYLSYSQVQGDTRYNKAKVAEIKDRVDHV